MKYIIHILFCLFLSQVVFSQAHNVSEGSSCQFAKKKCIGNSGCSPCAACDKKDEKEKKAIDQENKRRVDEKIIFGALAIDRSNGFYYGWAYDYPDLAEAERRAIDECTKKGGDCSVVLSFSGAGCAAYRTINGKVGNAFGWGLATTKEQADAIAKSECLKRSKGVQPGNFVWTCNSQTKLPYKEIYNANDEITDVVDKTLMGAAHAICYSSDGKRMAVGSFDGYVRIYAMPSYGLTQLINVTGDTYTKQITQVVFSPDGKTLAVAVDRSRYVKIYNALTGKLEKTFDIEWGGAPGMSFSPDGKYFASGGRCSWDVSSCPGMIYIHETAGWSLVKTLHGHENDIRSTSFSQNSKMLSSTSIDGTAILWDVESGRKINTLSVSTDQGQEGLFSPDGKYFVTQGWDGDSKIKVWDANTGAFVRTLGGHGVFGESIAFLSSSKLVSIGSGGGPHNYSFIIWDIHSGAKILQQKTEGHWELSISPNGTLALAGSGGFELWKPDESGSYSLWKKRTAQQ